MLDENGDVKLFKYDICLFETSNRTVLLTLLTSVIYIYIPRESGTHRADCHKQKSPELLVILKEELFKRESCVALSF